MKSPYQYRLITLILPSAFFKIACHANAGSKWYIFKRIFLKILETSGKSNVSLLNINHNIYLNFLFQSLFKLFLHACN